MVIKFQKNEEWFTFYDSKGTLIERKTEVRFDPLTGETSRIVFDSGAAIVPPDYTEAAKQTIGVKCPFCPENLLHMTPVFPKEVAKDGRIFQGKAVVFPNLFPYSKHNGVVIFSDQHYIKLEQFTTELIMDAFLAAQTYIQNVKGTDPKAKYASINWNYLPYSGGSVLHPHIQAIVSESPTNYQTRSSNKLLEYSQDNDGIDFHYSLYHTEKNLGERWIGECGQVAWMHAFAPKSHNDFIAVFLQSHSIYDISEQDWADFARGLQAIFATLTEQGFASFNLALNVALDQEARQLVYAHLIPRITIGKLNTSDINVFQALQNEPLSFKTPEVVAAIARNNFQKL
ncbi:hypothetical protein [Calidifontibacillus oryziterrae]|uniref:hypothetical protein n=1 Tax=Calidifontibacillus oryziterrae TaxID=1191699 RepID=UPI0003042E0C|nr:hypothetical protein [Calidifontibacillus oryziterrae]